VSEKKRCNGIRFTKDDLERLHCALGASLIDLQTYLRACRTYGNRQDREMFMPPTYTTVKKVEKLRGRIAREIARMV
jgi:hypothetical protein